MNGSVPQIPNPVWGWWAPALRWREVSPKLCCLFWAWDSAFSVCSQKDNFRNLKNVCSICWNSFVLLRKCVYLYRGTRSATLYRLLLSLFFCFDGVIRNKTKLQTFNRSKAVCFPFAQLSAYWAGEGMTVNITTLFPKAVALDLSLQHLKHYWECSELL